MSFTRLSTSAIVAAVALCVSAAGWADKPIFGDTLYFGIGGMEQKSKVTFSSTRAGLPEYDLSLSDLGMDDKAGTVWAGVNWQFADRWGVGVSYSGFSTDGVATAEQSGNFGDIEWTAGATLTSEYDLDLYIVDLHWEFINTGPSHVGLGVGLHIADLRAAIGFELDSVIGGVPVPIDSGYEVADVTAPLPNVLIRAGHRFGDNLYVGVKGGYFALKVNDIDGQLTSFLGNVEWRPTRHFGLGAGYQYVEVDVTNDGSSRKKKSNTKIYGPLLFVSVGF